MHVIFQVIILGIVEGLSEFLPISSTGHLIVTQQLVGFQDYKEIFTVVIQVGAIAAVIWFYRKDLWAKTMGLIRRQKDAIRFWQILAFGTIPALGIGFVAERYMETYATVLVIAISLIVGGIILWIVDHKPVDSSKEQAPDLGAISLRQALIVGFGQCIALIPGVSRSGATIVSGLLTGIDRATATAFSFYLSIPVLVLASAYKLLKYEGGVAQIDGGLMSLVLGLVVSFFVALAAIAWLLRYVSRHNFTIFAYYRIVLGIVLLGLIAFFDF